MAASDHSWDKREYYMEERHFSPSTGLVYCITGRRVLRLAFFWYVVRRRFLVCYRRFGVNMVPTFECQALRTAWPLKYAGPTCWPKCRLATISRILEEVKPLLHHGGILECSKVFLRLKLFQNNTTVLLFGTVKGKKGKTIP